MTALYIITLCGVLYFSRLPRLLIEAVRLDSRQTEISPASNQAEPQHPQTIERRKAEAITANILLYEGYKGDAFGKAKRMTDEEQSELIKRFKNDLGI